MSKHWPILTILVITLLAFYPIFGGKVPLNARNLVSFFSPWYYQKFEGFPAGVPSKPGMPDQLRLYFPYMALTQWFYRQGQLPLWNPYNFAGNPHMAESQSGVFYPLHILLPFLPLPIYWSLFQITGFFLAGFFTYWYLRNLGISKMAGLFGGTTFMLSSFLSTWNMEVVTAPQSILWMPLILLAVDKIVGWPRTNLTLRRGLRPRPQRAMVRGSGVPADFSNEKSGSVRKTWWLVGLGGLVLSILSGYWQTTFYVMAVSAIYAMYRVVTERKLSVIRYPLSVISWFPFALALTAFQLLPTWELYQRSGRPIVNFRPEIRQVYLDYLLPLRHLVTVFAPDYFGHPTTRNYFANVGGGSQYYEHALFIGTIPLMLAVLAIIYAIKNRRMVVIFWSVISVITASFSFRTPWARLIYDLRVPLLSTGIANRILFIPAFGLSILAAYGWEFSNKKNSQKILRVETVGGLILIAVLFLVTWLTRSSLGALDPKVFPTLYVTSIRNMIIPTVTFVSGSLLMIFGAKKKKWANVVLSCVLVISTAQNLYQHHKFTAFSEKNFVYPLHPTIEWIKNNVGIDRFIGYNGQFLNNNFATYFQIYVVEGYDSLNDYRRSLFLQSAETGSIGGPLHRSVDALLGQNLTSQRILRLMQIFGIKYLVDRPDWLDVGSTAKLPRLPKEKERLVFHDGDWRIWEYLDVYPRAFLVGNYEVVNDGQETIDRLYSDSFNPRETLLLSKPLPEGFRVGVDENSGVSVEKYTPTKIVFKTKSKTNQLLFLSDTYYPGWWYRVDNGEKQPVLVADYALRAAPVTAGEHTVIMWYFPNSFRNGIVISVMGLVTVGFIYFVILSVSEGSRRDSSSRRSSGLRMTSSK